MVRLGPLPGLWPVHSRPLVACLTGLEAQRAFECPEDRLHGLPLLVVGPIGGKLR